MKQEKFIIAKTQKTTKTQKIVEPAIEVKNISKTFTVPGEKVASLRGAFTGVFKKKTKTEFKALKDISFTIKKGEFFGIIGRNGSGKSTLLKILAGIYQPDRGKVKINGRIAPFLELGIGFNLELSGKDNIILNATVLGLTQKEIAEKMEVIVEFSELGHFINQKIKNYSSGMQMRLAFSIILNVNREIMLMDEVLAVGDTNFQQKCLEEFMKYRDLGKTIILVTHNTATVQKYCDRALLLRHGQIKKIGSPEQVANAYIYDNMTDEEKRLVGQEKRLRIKAQEEACRLEQEQRRAEEKRIKKEERHKTEEEKRRLAEERRLREEEKRRLAEERERLEEEKRNKVAEITKVEFLDKDGKAKNVFMTGDDIVARIYYKASKIVRKPVFGIAIHTQDGVDLTGPNTKNSNFKIESIIGNGSVDFCIKNNCLLADKYYFTAVIYDWSCLIPYEIKDKKYSFKIFPKKERPYGIINIEHIWKKN
jgi:lipopolysaccharide transport system ATP-binding protein